MWWCGLFISYHLKGILSWLANSLYVEELLLLSAQTSEGKEMMFVWNRILFN